MTVATGSVVMFRAAQDGKAAYGFIKPDVGWAGSTDNVYFPERALAGSRVRIGDRVEYVISDRATGKATTSIKDRPHAVRVEVIESRRQITTTGGWNADR